MYVFTAKKAPSITMFTFGFRPMEQLAWSCGQRLSRWHLCPQHVTKYRETFPKKNAKHFFRCSTTQVESNSFKGTEMTT
jgi:hypothetical protein